MLANKWIAVIAFPVLAVFVLACGGKSDQGIAIEQTNSSGVSLTPGAPPATLAAAPTAVGAPASADEVATFANNFGKVKSFKANLSQSGGASSPQGTIEYSAPDKIHVVVKVGNANQEITCIGDSFYFKRGTDAWQKAPPGGPSCRVNLGPADPAALAEGIRKAAEDKTLNKGGQETVNGKRCQIYLQSAPNGASFEMCVADGLPVRLVSKDPQQTLTIIFSDIDKPIDIKAPI